MRSTHVLGHIGFAAMLAGFACGQPVEWRAEDGGNGHWYENHPTSLQTWEEARDWCAVRGGHLVTVNSEAERAFLQGALGRQVPGEHGYVGMYQDRGAGDYAEPDGGWRWTTGEPVVYWPFGSGEPNNDGGGQDYGLTYGDFYFDDWSPGTCCTPVWITIEWDADCNGDGIVDHGQILSGQLPDANGNEIPDSCESWCTQWQESTPATMPPPRFLFAMAYDEARSKTVLFGGESSAAEHEFGDTWLFDGAAWTQASVPGPSDRSDPVMAYDPVRERIVLFGGSFVPDGGSRVTFGETWEWDGAHWHLASQDGPPPRQAAAMAFDGLRNRMVMAGGSRANVQSGHWEAYSDCWEWDGQTWSQVASMPDARGGARMAFDSIRGQLVVFGGSSQFGGLAATTLVRTGTTWAVATSDGPAPRVNHMMAFLPTLGETVMFGGTLGHPDGEVNDTWLWDGSTWHQPTLAMSPSRRESGGMVYDAARERLVMVLGWLANTNTFLSEQWELLANSLSITTQPADQALLVGQEAVFHVVVSGTPTAVQWRRDGSALTDDGRITGSQTTTLSIATMQSSDQGDYDCVISGACGSVTSDTAILTCRPVFTQQPLGGTFQAGQTFVLSAATASQDAVSYRWRKDGNNLFNSGLYSGVTTPVLTVHSEDPTQSGTYTLRATNGCGTTTSLEAEVVVYCGADFDRSGFVDLDDFTAFVDAFEDGTDNADFDHSGFVDLDDFSAFVYAFEAGC